MLSDAPRGASELGVVELSAFRLLANARHLTILERLMAGPCSAAELRDVLGGVKAATVHDDLHRLHAAAVLRRVGSVRPYRWELTDAGRQLNRLRQIATVFLRGLPTPIQLSVPGLARLARLADPRSIAIGRTLAIDGPAHAAEIERRLAGSITHRGVQQRLVLLTAAGILRRQAATRSQRRYLFNPEWRAIGGVLLLAARWELSWGRPASFAVASDLAGLLAIAAPVTQLVAGVDGRCLLVVESAETREPFVSVTCAGGVLTVAGGREEPATPAADVRASGPPLAWSETLVSGEPVGLTIDGRAELLDAVLAAFWQALFRRLQEPSAR